MKTKIKAILLLIIFGLLFISCSDDSSTEPEKTTDPGKTTTKDFEVKKIDVPEKMKQVQDAKAAIAMAWVNAANGFQAYSSWFQIPQNATSGQASGNKTYTWTQGGLSVTMFYAESSSNISWKLVFNGTENGISYNNWTYLEASQSADQKNGWMKVYKQNSTDVQSEWNWTTDASGKYTFVMQNHNDTSMQTKIEVVSNPDLSGELYYYVNNSMTSKTTWDKDGNGQWWEYDENGNLIDSGSWTAS